MIMEITVFTYDEKVAQSMVEEGQRDEILKRGRNGFTYIMNKKVPCTRN